MDANVDVLGTITPSNESEVLNNTADCNNCQENLIEEEKAGTDMAQKGDTVSEHTNVNIVENMAENSQDISQTGTENTLINETESMPIETTDFTIENEISTVLSTAEESIINTPTQESVGHVDTNLESSIVTNENTIDEDINIPKSDFGNNASTVTNVEFSTKISEENPQMQCNEMGPNLTGQMENNDKEIIQIPISNKDISDETDNLQKLLETSLVDETQNSLGDTSEQILNDKITKVENLETLNVTTNIEQDNVNVENSVTVHPEQNLEIDFDISVDKIQEKAISDNPVMTYNEQVVQDNVNEVNENSTDCTVVIGGEQIVLVNKVSENSGENIEKYEQSDTVEQQIQSIHDTVLQKEKTNELVDPELSHKVDRKETFSKSDVNISVQVNTINVEQNTLNQSCEDNEVLEEEVDDAPDTDNIEKQMSNIVQQVDESDMKSQKTISIVEAISRDFDETDSEDIDKADNVEEPKTVEVTQDNVIMGVNISDELQHETVTVTDTSGQIYYVQSVEDLIVVENDDISDTLDEPETFEVTVVSEVEESVQSVSKSKEKPSIPSHILGRNIDNPVIDTFRNGKVPPKPRLGVKIPYKNLTSQIVTKDEIAKEILERQKQKYKQLGQTTREILFAKQLTQRLAKKIAPSTSTKSARSTLTKAKDETINNSDLLAILEGDEDDSESRKNQVASTSKLNTIETADNIKQSPLSKTEPGKKQKDSVPMSKLTEREIALKQLKELPMSPNRRRKLGVNLSTKKFREPESETQIIKNEPRLEIHKNSIQQPEKEDIGNVEELKTSNKKVAEVEQNLKVEQKTVNTKTSITAKSDQIEPITHAIGTQDSTSLTKIKTTEAKQPVPNEITKLVSEENIDNTKLVEVKQTPPQIIKPESTDASTKIKATEGKESILEVVTQPEASEIGVKTKSDETKQLLNLKANDNSKNVDASLKPASIKVTESSKVNKIDSLTADLKEEFIERKHISNPPIKTYTRKRKSTEDSSIISNVPDKKPTITQKYTNIPPNTYVTKSSRIIKRKVIWDPDEPSTARSLVTRSPKADLLKAEKSFKSEISPSKIDKKALIKTVTKTETSKSPTKSPDTSKSKKRLSEVDRLLMDEGAVNMLYAFKNVDDSTKKKKTDVISLDKAQRDLINKTNELKKDLKTNSDKISPKSLRRKDSPVPTPTKKVVPASVSRKKSKDSNRSSLHSPPASPGMIYLNHAEASRIIRRHSSSSYSSMEGDFEADKKVETDIEITTTMDSEKTNKKRNASSNTDTNKNKKAKKSTDKENVTIVIEKGKTHEDMSKNFSKLVENDETEELKYSKYKTFSVKEVNHMVQIILLPSFNNEAYLTPEILNELCSIIKELQEDVNCTVVVFSSSASSFCHGINYKTLLSDKEQNRKAFARKLATCVTNFLRVLATFPKILVAGVHGDTVGLGVTILPLFDMVIASDTATFSIPNARLGCAVEGGSLLSLPHLMHNVLVSELLYASRKLIAAEALRLGMVTRVLWPDKFQQELVTIVKAISNYSPQFMELTKKQLRQCMTEHIETVLNKEVDTLVQHWTSSECQKNFGVYG